MQGWQVGGPHLRRLEAKRETAPDRETERGSKGEETVVRQVSREGRDAAEEEGPEERPKATGTT